MAEPRQNLPPPRRWPSGGWGDGKIAHICGKSHTFCTLLRKYPPVALYYMCNQNFYDYGKNRPRYPGRLLGQSGPRGGLSAARTVGGPRLSCAHRRPAHPRAARAALALRPHHPLRAGPPACHPPRLRRPRPPSPHHRGQLLLQHQLPLLHRGGGRGAGGRPGPPPLLRPRRTPALRKPRARRRGQACGALRLRLRPTRRRRGPHLPCRLHPRAAARLPCLRRPSQPRLRLPRPAAPLAGMRGAPLCFCSQQTGRSLSNRLPGHPPPGSGAALCVCRRQRASARRPSGPPPIRCSPRRPPSPTPTAAPAGSAPGR